MYSPVFSATFSETVGYDICLTRMPTRISSRYYVRNVLLNHLNVRPMLGMLRKKDFVSSQANPPEEARQRVALASRNTSLGGDLSGSCEVFSPSLRAQHPIAEVLGFTLLWSWQLKA